MILRRCVALALVAGLSGACSAVFLKRVPDGGPLTDGGAADGGPDGGAPDAGPPNPVLVCDLLNAARCAFLAQCGLLPDGGDALRDCLAFYAATNCGPGLWPARVNAGTLKLDAQAARTCLDQYATFACSDYPAEPAACGALYLPATPLHGACYGSPYTECEQGVCRGTTCPYFCQAPGAAGDVCEENADCLPDAGLYCHFNGATAASLCTQLGGQGALCDAQTPCAFGYSCAGSRCAAWRTLSQSCTTGACDPSTWCDADGGVCALREDAGMRCQASLQCEAGLVCTSTGTCQPQGPLPQGASCGAGQSCAAPLACVPEAGADAGTCWVPSASGASCATSQACEAWLACHLEADGGTCGLKLADGSPCQEDADCEWGALCVGRCLRKAIPGEACGGAGCLFGACAASDAGAFCVGLAQEGMACTSASQCASGRCFGACVQGCSP